MTYSFEGIEIEDRLAPDSIDAACDAVKACGDRGSAIFPAGGATALDYGLPPSKPGVLFETTALSQLDDYPSEDMTITVETGITMANLAGVLGEKNQMLPIDVPQPDSATLGGVLATNTSGPRRYGYGTMRDYVIGIDVIDAEGRRVHGGGRVVKNVAGYDLMKLHTGALGTLGVVVQTTLKLRPLPEARAIVTCSLQDDQVEPALELFCRSATRPVAIELLFGVVDNVTSSEEGRPWRLVVLFEESAPAVDWQIQQLKEEWKQLGIAHIEVPDRDRYDGVLTQLTGWPAKNEGMLTFKANLLPGRVVDFCSRTLAVFPDAALLSHAANGIVWCRLTCGELSEIEAGLTVLRGMAVESGGNLMVAKCPVEWKASLPVWGAARADWRLMQRLKQKLDPNDLFNPGRFVTSVATVPA